jgi:cytochrome b561
MVFFVFFFNKTTILQGQRKAWHIPSPINLTWWPWKSIGFQILVRTKYVPSLVKIHWRMLILECSQGCYAVKKFDPVTLKINRFQIFLRTKYLPSLVKIHWKMLILECSQECYRVKMRTCDLDLWPWKSIGFQTLLRTKYVPSLVKIHWRMLILVFTRMLCGKKIDLVTLTINRVPDFLKN